MTNRAVYLVLALLALAWGAIQIGDVLVHWRYAHSIGSDYHLYTTAAARWLAGGGFYHPYQLSGPYIIGDHIGGNGPILYPPTMLLLFVPFTVLPWILWWAIPIGVTAWVVRHHRPRPLVWPVLAFLVAFPTTLSAIETGNPTLWFTMALALGTVYGWPAILLVLKPTIAPLALIGLFQPEHGHRLDPPASRSARRLFVLPESPFTSTPTVVGKIHAVGRPLGFGRLLPFRAERNGATSIGDDRIQKLQGRPANKVERLHRWTIRLNRRWFVALVGLAAVSALFLPMWGDYLTVIANTGNRLGPFYSLNQAPTLFIPLIAWLARVPEHPHAAELLPPRVGVDPVGRRGDRSVVGEDRQPA